MKYHSCSQDNGTINITTTIDELAIMERGIDLIICNLLVAGHTLDEVQSYTQVLKSLTAIRKEIKKD